MTARIGARCSWMLGALAAYAAVVAPPARAEEIYVGGILGMTGPIAASSAPFSQGVLDYFRWINDEKGGINGRRVKFFWQDAHYSIPASVEFYKEILRHGHPTAVFGVGTGDTVALLSSVTRDKVPFFSASCSDSLANPAKAPYNFFVNTTYGDQMQVALRFIANANPGTHPKAALISIDNAMGRDPLPAAHAFAASLGLALLPDQVLDVARPDAKPAAAELAKAGADYVIIHGVGATTVAVLDAFKGLAKPPKVIGLQYAFDDGQLARLGRAAEGMYGVTTFSLWGDAGPGVLLAKKVWTRYHRDEALPSYMYLIGMAQVLALEEAIRRAGTSPTAAAVTAQLEALSDFGTQGLAPAVTFSRTRHNGAHSARIRQVKGGKLTAVTELITLKE